MATLKTPQTIGGEITKQPHNDNYTLLKANDDALNADVSNLENQDAINKAELQANIDAEEQSRIAGDETLDTRIDNIIAQSGTSDTEVVDARTSTTLGETFTVLKDRFENVEGKYLIKTTATHTQNLSLEDLPTESLDAPISELDMQYVTLVNEVSGQDILNGNSVTFDSINGDIYYDSLNDANITGDGTTKTVTNNTGTTADIMIINKTALGIGSFSNEQMYSLTRIYFDGMSANETSVLSTRGKNLFDKNKVIYNKYIASTGGLADASTNNVSEKIEIDNSKTYVLSGRLFSQPSAIYYAYYDYNSKFISSTTMSGLDNLALTPPSKARYVRITVNDIELNTVQLEEGTVATAYEPYKSSTLSIEGNFGSVPSVADRVFEADGEVWLEKNTVEYELQSSDVTAWTTTGTNVHWVAINKANLTGYKFDGVVTDSPGSVLWDIAKETRLIPFDDVENEETISTNAATGSFLYIVEKNKYADLAEAQSDLAGTKIRYQLATPQLINLTEQGLASGGLLSFENGSMSVDGYFAELTAEVATNRASVIDRTVEGVQANAKAIDKGLTRTNRKIDTAFNADLVAYEGNTATSVPIEDAADFIISGGTGSTDTTNSRIGPSGVRMTITNAGASSLILTKNNVNFDFSKLINGEDSGDDDYIEVGVYCSNVNAFNLVNHSLSQGATHDIANRKSYSSSPATLGVITGYKKVQLKKSLFTTTGTGAWSGIQSFILQANHNAGYVGEYIMFDFMINTKKDPEADYPNPFQRNVVRDFAINSGEWFVGKEFGRTILRELTNVAFDADSFVQSKEYSEFTATFTFVASATSTGYIGVTATSTDGYLVGVIANQLRLIDATGVILDFKNVSITNGDTLSVQFNQKGSVLNVEVKINNQDTIYLRKDNTTTTSKRLTIARRLNATTILSASITNLPHAHSSDIATVAKSLEEQAKAKVFNNVAQSVPNATTTAVVFNTVRYDNRNHFNINSPTRLTCRENGNYDLKANIRFAGNATGDRFAIITVNGTIVAYDRRYAVGTEACIINLSTDYDLKVGDYVEAKVYQSSGAPLNVDSGLDYSPILSIRKNQ